MTIAAVYSCKDKQTATIVKVSAEEADTLIKSDDVTLVDVRQQRFFQDRHLANAINIPVENDSLNEALDRLDPNQPILIYCNTGKSSERCATILKEKGFKKIYDLEGGLEQWEASGRQVIIKNN